MGSVRRVKIGRTRALTSPSTMAAIARAWLDNDVDAGQNIGSHPQGEGDDQPVDQKTLHSVLPRLRSLILHGLRLNPSNRRDYRSEASPFVNQGNGTVVGVATEYQTAGQKGVARGAGEG